MSEAFSRNNELLSVVYAGAAEAGAAPTWDEAREAKHIEQQERHELWGQELKSSRVGQLLLSCNGLKSGRGSFQGQGDDGFELQPGSSNVLSLHYLFPANTRWNGEFITADLTVSESGQKVWGINVLTGIRPEPQIIGGYDHGFKNIAVYGRTEFPNEHGASEFLEDYIQTHDCAQTLREVIERNLKIAGLIKPEGPAPQA